MSVVIYIAHVTGDEAAGYSASFPDLSGVTVASSAIPGLLRDARERLVQELHRLTASGADWPAPATMERLRESFGVTGFLMLIDVQVEDAPVRVNISIGERLLKRIDDAAESQSMTRSGFIAAAVRQRLGDEADPHPAAGSDTQKIYDEVIALGRRVNEAIGPDSAIGRTLVELDNRAVDGLRKLAGDVASAVGRRSREKRPNPGSTDEETVPNNVITLKTSIAALC